MIKGARDLVVLVADKNMEESLHGMFARYDALGIRPMDYVIYVHPQHDPGCLRNSQDILRPFAQSYQYALVMLDREGCGSSDSRERLEQVVEARLSSNGWETRCAVIVLDPELEMWVWSTSTHVESVLGWADRLPPMRQWLRENGYLLDRSHKPVRPKETMEKVLRQTGKPRSSSIYRQLAERVSLQGHQDPAFQKLCEILRTWFPRE